MRFDVAIIGGAVMGASAAFWLTRMDPALKVVVIEQEPQFLRSATALSVASIRQQFSTPVNIRISRFGIEFIRDFDSYLGLKDQRYDLGFKENGYLFLTDDPGRVETMSAIASLQRDLGAATEVLSPAQLASRFPYLETSDLAAGSFGPRDEGWFDNMGLLGGLRAAAKAAGATFRTGRVVGLHTRRGQIDRVEAADGDTLSCGAVVNAAGTGAAAIMRMVGEAIPVEPRKRTVFLVDAPNARHPGAPLIVDASGFYARPEHDRWITAIVPKDDCATGIDDFEPNHSDFEDIIWEKLYHRIPGFDMAKVMRCWVGHYDFNTLDQNAIVGRHPNIENLYLMNGFSGHGLQQAPAIGRGIAELLLSNGYQTIDLEPLCIERVLGQRALREIAIV